MPYISHKSIDGFMRPSMKRTATTPTAKKPTVAKPEATISVAPKRNMTRGLDEISAEIAVLEQYELEASDSDSTVKTTAKKHRPIMRAICLLLLLAEVIAGGFFIYLSFFATLFADWQKYTITAAMALVFFFTAYGFARSHK